ncbi:nuclear transport factor 2 family protein [Rhodococcus marinonascens]|uniref:nuclear transport factor 2 family protein n=1 Tax=Rhodococcus marinonascens TaxID=38311 RepID=UPI0009336A89|nr:nuclear transport factor 2 family protein [Rhodococcus marinonascens]
MNQNEQLIHTLYTAIQNKEFEVVKSCYHENATFSDNIFPNLSGKEPAAMWHMMIGSTPTLELSYDSVKADEFGGGARWIGNYTFSETGRSVRNNIIHASFEFKDGKIIRHEDSFDLYRWSRMALGPTGWLLGWTPLFKKSLQKQAAGLLPKFIHDHPEYGS